MSFLLDADTCSAYLRGERIVQNKFLQYLGQLYLATITVGELSAWTLRVSAPPRRRQAFLAFLRDVTILDIDATVANRFGEMRAHLLDQGQPSPVLDLFIAATAFVHQLTLVTHNTHDFINIPGLSIADWLVP